VIPVAGREKEKRRMRRLMESGKAEFLAVYGRRRVGKTFLIRQFFEKDLCFQMSGSYGSSTEDQLYSFAEALAPLVKSKVPLPIPKTWREAFSQLRDTLEALPKSRRKDARRVIFLDELPWLDTHRSRFLPALGYFWNQWASEQKDVILVVCGSAATWMIRRLLYDRGGLHNRVTARMNLQPFSLSEIESFLRLRGIKLTRKQIAEIAMVTGGVPHYLNELRKGRSVEQIIGDLCFLKSSLLRDEFDKLYHSLFAQADNHVEVVRALAKKRSGLTRSEIVKATSLASGGGLTSVLRELEESGFIEGTLPYGKRKKDVQYRLIDEYSHFYLTWIEPAKRRKQSWQKVVGNAKWKAWSGYAFESLCHRHIPQIKAALGIAAVSTEISTFRKAGKGKSEQGAQVDLVINRADGVIHLCEIKFSATPFGITKKYAGELQNKLDVFQQELGGRKAVFLTFITASGLKDNDYQGVLVQQEIVLDDLFIEVLEV
jgi:uncharacterized protein